MKFSTTFLLTFFLPAAVRGRPQSSNGSGNGKPVDHPGQGQGIPDFVKDKFKSQNGIKKDFDLEVQEVGHRDAIRISDGSSFTLDGLKAVSVFSSEAKCHRDGVQVRCPAPTVFSKDFNNRKVVVSMDSKGYIDSVKVKGKGKTEVLQAIAPGFIVNIPEVALDSEFFEKFEMRANDPEDRVRRQLRGNIAAHASQQQRGLQSSCSSYRIVEVAVAVESSFCAAVGESNVEAKVASLMADVATDYEADGLCFSAVVSHLEVYCNSATDPCRYTTI